MMCSFKLPCLASKPHFFRKFPKCISNIFKAGRIYNLSLIQSVFIGHGSKPLQAHPQYRVPDRSRSLYLQPSKENKQKSQSLAGKTQMAVGPKYPGTHLPKNGGYCSPQVLQKDAVWRPNLKLNLDLLQKPPPQKKKNIEGLLEGLKIKHPRKSKTS